MSNYGSRTARSANRNLGQHFLQDQHIIADIIKTMVPNADDHILEIGPGRAALTAPLMDSGARIHAVEIDRRLAATLRRRWPALDLIEADVLKLDLADLLSRERWRLIGNLPYNIASELLTRLALVADHFIDGLFMLQEEVALRMAATPKNRKRGRLSVWMQYHFEVDLLFEVPPSAFNPKPAVNSRMLRLRPRPSPLPLVDSALFQIILKAAFGQKRKHIHNALKSLGTHFPQLNLTTLLANTGIDQDRRAETLSVAEFVTLTNTAHATLNTSATAVPSVPAATTDKIAG